MTFTLPYPRTLGRVFLTLAVCGFCFVFAFFLSVAAWPLVGALFILVAAVTMLMVGFERLSLIWIIGIPSVFTYGNNVGSVLPLFTVERLLFLILLGILIAGTAVGVRQGGKLDKVERTSLLLLAIMTLSMSLLWTTVSADNWRPDGALLLTGYFMPFGGYAIARRIRWTSNRVQWLLGAILLNAAFLALVGFLQYVFDFRMLNATYMETQHSDESYVRGIGTFGASWEYGAVSAVFILIGFHLLSGAKAAFSRLILLGLMGSALLSLLISLTRAPMIAMVFGLAAMAFLDKSVRRIAVPMFVIGAFAILLSLPLVMSSESVMDRLTELSPIYNRLALYVTSINMGLQNLFLGIGFGGKAFSNAASEYMISFGGVQANWMLGVSVPHNEFLHILVTCGLPALLLFILIFYQIAQESWVGARNVTASASARKMATLAFGAIVVHFLVMNTLDTGFGRYFSLLVFFIAGMAKALGEQAVDDERFSSASS